MHNYIDTLNLEPHIEGGYFGVFYKSKDKIIINDKRYANESQQGMQNFNVERHAGSSIYFLLEKEDYSAWHRIKSDEIWHYYDGGSAIDIHTINEHGKLETFTLGNPRLIKNAAFQVVMKAGTWFAAELRDKQSFALAGCTVCPAFEYADFELAAIRRDELVAQYPELKEIIDKFIGSECVEVKK